MKTYKYEAAFSEDITKCYILINTLCNGVNEPWGYIKLGVVLSNDYFKDCLNVLLELINTKLNLKPVQVLEYIRKISPSAGIKRGYIEELWDQI